MLPVSLPWPLAHWRIGLDASTLPQYSKCPISSDIATLYVCAVHDSRVRVLDVENMGWNACGTRLQVVARGANLTEANPFASLATISPCGCCVRSWTITVNPAAVSNMCNFSRSPLFMKKSLLGTR